jgi:hypothetical protein
MTAVLSEKQRALIIGTLLGDGHLNKRGNSYRLKIEHSINQKEYVMWKYNILKNVCLTTKPPHETFNGGPTILFYTSSGSYLEEIYHMFYKQDPLTGRFVKKITPELIENIPLNSLVLTSWFLDDGDVRDNCYAGKLATQCFSKDENVLLCQYLEKWGIGAKVVLFHRKKNQYYISLPARNYAFGKLIEIIESDVSQIPTMKYKLNRKRYKPRND